MIRIDCPNCGVRNAAEFRFGGEYNPRPPHPLAVSEEEWSDYIFMRRNRAGVQTEWWYHRNGCGMWFLVERDTRSNVVARTYAWRPRSSTASSEDAAPEEEK